MLQPFLSFCLPLFWARAPTRAQAGGFVLLLYLFGALEQPLAIVRVLPHFSPVAALGLWGIHGALLTLPWLLTWQPRNRPLLRHAVAFLAALLLGLAPPFGVLGWMHPLTVSGWLYPAWGVWGLIATTALLLGWVVRATHWTLGLGGAALIANLLYQPAPPPPDWVGINTQLGRAGTDAASRMTRQTDLMALVENQLKRAPRVIILPEEIAGPWTAAEAFWWQPVLAQARARAVTLVLGAQQVGPLGLRNGALIVEPTRARWQLARQPIPLADAALPLALSPSPDSGITQIAGQQVQFSFCYEDLLTLPMLVSAVQAPAPQIIISVANQWWANNMDEPDVQQNAIAGWGRLWKIPVVRAVNRPGQESADPPRQLWPQSAWPIHRWLLSREWLHPDGPLATP